MPDLDYRLPSFPSLAWRDPERTGAVVRLVRQTTEAAVSDQHLGLLYELARGLHHASPATDGYVVELGTYSGGSASALAMGVRDSRDRLKPVVTVDCYGWPHPGLVPGEMPHDYAYDEHYIQARQTFWKLGVAWDYVCQMITRSNDTFFNLWNKPIRVIFIDSSHLYDLTCQEIAGALGHMVEDGWMVFHDYQDDRWGAGVIPAVNRFLDMDEVWEKEVFRADFSCVLVHLKRRL